MSCASFRCTWAMGPAPAPLNLATPGNQHGDDPSGRPVMGTRCGDIDPGILISLIQSGEYTAEELDTLLNKQSGQGLSGISNDLREIELQAGWQYPGTAGHCDIVHRARKSSGYVGGGDGWPRCRDRNGRHWREQCLHATAFVAAV